MLREDMENYLFFCGRTKIINVWLFAVLRLITCEKDRHVVLFTGVTILSKKHA